MVQCYSTYETINQFSFGDMIKHSLNCNKLFRVQAENVLSVSFTSGAIETIRDCLKKKNKCEWH